MPRAPQKSPEPDALNSLADCLLQWYDQQSVTHAAQKMPWRGCSDPYKIWISEVMLQQTQVATVVDYYHRWLRKFPTVETLAAADSDTVLKVWEGLGYYSRARNLHRAAKVIVSEFAGHFPATFNDLKKLPGIGEYTAAAIASIAFHEVVPVVDGNVLRVFSRLVCLADDIGATGTKPKIRLALQNLISPDRPGDFNESLMDLGRDICQPRQPQCEVCPVAEICQAFQTSRQLEYPVKKRSKPTPIYPIVVGVIYKNGKILIQRRPPNGLLGGLWEFPGGKIEDGESPEAALIREIREEVGIEVSIETKLTRLKHAYTHFKINLTCFVCHYQSGTAAPKAATAMQWVSPEELTRFAFPKANQKIIPLLINGITG